VDEAAAGASAAIGAGAAMAPAATPTASKAETIMVTGLFIETPAVVVFDGRKENTPEL